MSEFIHFATAETEALLVPGGLACACGRRHATGLRVLRIGEGVLDALPRALRALGVSRPFLVADTNTRRAAGLCVEALLDAADIPYVAHPFAPDEAKPEPDERAVGALLMAFDPACDAVLAVGSGVINDCCKVLAHAMGRPQITVATAPSMDGYASNSSSMVRRRVKETLYNACPVAIFADTRVLCAAPMPMLRAGLGDMLAKYVSIAEWRVARLVVGDPYCENIAGLVRRSLKECLDAAPGLLRRDPAAVEAVTRGLVLSGVAMAFAETSRPASGLEHYFSHIWEMMALERGVPSDLHGAQVGVGTLLTLRILDRVRALKPGKRHALEAMAAFSPAAWEAQTRAIFGATAPAIIEVETRYHKNDPAAHAKRLAAILSNWPKILHIFEEELPDTVRIEDLMRTLRMPTTPAALGISREDTKNALLASRDIRDKYLTSSLLWDLGLLADVAKDL